MSPSAARSPRDVVEPSRNVEVYDDVDVLVIGGGPAGVSAAVGAARAGARTALVERHGFFGGMWTAGMVLTLAGFNSWLRPYQRCVAGVAGEWIDRAADEGGALPGPGFVINSDPETMKRVADTLLEEAGVTLYLHTWGATPIMDGDRVRGAFVENVDGRRAILASVTVDATGDGDVIARSGAEWVKSESLQPMTMTFRLGNVRTDPAIRHDLPVTLPIGPEPGQLTDPILTDYSSARNDVPLDAAAMASAREAGRLPRYGGPWFGGVEKDVLWVNATRVVGDASDAREFTRAEIQGRRDTQQITDWFRHNVPGLEDSHLLHTGTQIGVRETRRLVGELVMTGDDVRSGRAFDDSIAVGCWPIDVHPTEKVVGTHAMYVPKPFDISYRVLVPQRVEGLLAAGRCVSVDREALGSMRVGATCAAMGQAAGVAAASAVSSSVRVRDVDVSSVRATLRDQGAIVDAADVAIRT
jgi:hypothetical protein